MLKIATAYLSKQEVTSLYSDQAKMLEQQGRYKEAEKFEFEKSNILFK